MIIRDPDWKPPKKTEADYRVDRDIARQLAFNAKWGHLLRRFVTRECDPPDAEWWSAYGMALLRGTINN